MKVLSSNCRGIKSWVQSIKTAVFVRTLYSYFDLGVSEISKEDFFRVKNLLEGIEDELNIPHSVDIINFDAADNEFVRQVILQGVELWKQ